MKKSIQILFCTLIILATFNGYSQPLKTRSSTSISMGSTVYQPFGKDYMLSSYVFPSFTTYSSPKLEIRTGFLISNTHIPGLKSTNLENSNSIKSDFNNVYLVNSAAYKLNSNLIVNGNLITSVYDSFDKNSLKNTNNIKLKSASIGLQYNISERFSIEANFNYNNYNNIDYFNPYTPYSPSSFQPIMFNTFR